MANDNMYQKFVADMIERARENEAAMTPMDQEQQSKYMLDQVRHHDACLALIPTDEAVGGHSLCVITGQDVLEGAGFNLAVVEQVSNPVRPRPRRLNRPLRVGAFFVGSYREARYLDISFGDSAYAKKMRKWQEEDGGPEAVRNMRQATTPAGRAYICANPHLFQTEYQ